MSVTALQQRLTRAPSLKLDIGHPSLVAVYPTLINIIGDLAFLQFPHWPPFPRMEVARGFMRLAERSDS